MAVSDGGRWLRKNELNFGVTLVLVALASLLVVYTRSIVIMSVTYVTD